MSKFRGGYLFNVGFHYATEDEKNSSQKFDCALWQQRSRSFLKKLRVPDWPWISLDALKFLVSWIGSFGKAEVVMHDIDILPGTQPWKLL